MRKRRAFCVWCQRGAGQLEVAREPEHPEDAIPIYERKGEALIDKRNDAGFRDAVKLMVHVESRYVRVERPDAFAKFVEHVRSDPRTRDEPDAARRLEGLVARRERTVPVNNVHLSQ